MKVKINGDDKLELLDGVENVLRMRGVKHILLAVEEGKCFVASDMENQEMFEMDFIHALWGACHTRQGVMLELAKMARIVLDMKEPEETKC